ncbi:MAG: WYL domain-containing protein, partial [Lachnospiraceae bacterium]|nr:WYL domain-containing protein [Lachnospiraceae bacterium]
MYGGKEEKVHLICKNDFAGIIIDRFGKDISFSKVDDEHFEVTVNVVVSGLFFGWIMGLGDGIRISEPPEVVDKMKEEIKRLHATYGM